MLGSVTLACAAAMIIGLAAVSAQPVPSIWNGVYTKAQVNRGTPLYAQKCASCHGEDLGGGETAGALADGQFRANWDGTSVGDLFDRIRVSMPQDAPGTLTRQQSADILAFLLFRNEFPPGEIELSTRTEVLKEIAFEGLKP